MPDPWSAEEVRLAVEDYFAMLREELLGVDYSKAAHRRQLAPYLRGRSAGSLERKHQNISAVLIELGLPYIDGYKPLPNYQRLLRAGVVDLIGRHRELLRELSTMSEAVPSAMPPVCDVDAILVEPPEPLPGPMQVATDLPHAVRSFDFLGRDALNRQLGRVGEQFVLAFEAARLARAGRRDLAERIEWVSEARGDGVGFDIASFDEDGRDRAIEVKTTNQGRCFPFLVSRNEVVVSESSDNFWLYRVFGFNRQPRLFMLPGAIPAHCQLEPTAYRASFGGAA